MCGMVRIVEDDEEANRTLQACLTTNQNLVDIKVAELLCRVESAVGECLVVVDVAATAQDSLRSLQYYENDLIVVVAEQLVNKYSSG